MLVGIIVKPHSPEVLKLLKETIALLQARTHEVLTGEETAHLLGGDWAGTSREEMMKRCELIVVLGGDGTLLSLAKYQVGRQVPILGVNMGQLGFLTEVAHSEALEQLEEALEGRMTRSYRMMLASELQRGDRSERLPHVLNDVVINKSALARIFDLDVLVDGFSVTNTRADGVIVSTPTGSTAYNLAANGPVVHPEMDVIIFTPICPHTLTNRPVVLSADMVVELRINDGEEIYLTLDGQQGFPLRGGDIVRVWRSERQVCLLVPSGRNYFDVLRNKLQWGKR
ncbi:MAG TPA: NAD(+)/NADH kinase [Acidobacteriota bacterium]|nr:NAD(+)/NADH kinase [Acidobacteriota bacterium]